MYYVQSTWNIYLIDSSQQLYEVGLIISIIFFKWGKQGSGG